MLKPFLNKSASHDFQKMSPSHSGGLICVVIALIWAWLPSLSGMLTRWNQDPQYSHGFFVPLVAGMIAWYRREDVLPCDSTPSAKGIVFVALGVVMYLSGAHIFFEWLEQVALLPILLGIAMIIGGRWLALVTWPAIAFLLFMIPLPFSVETAMAQPLQNLAGKASVFVLQMFGIAAIRNGNLIDVEGHILGVAEACSGMRMLVVFFAIATAIALLSRRHWVEKLILVVSAGPIALFCNVARIAVTGLLYAYAGPEMAEKIFHDLAGWMMMPVALLLMWIEMKYLSYVIEDRTGQRDSVGVFQGTLVSATEG